MNFFFFFRYFFVCSFFYRLVIVTAALNVFAHSINLDDNRDDFKCKNNEEKKNNEGEM